jgi:transcriptional regulator with XRE-family HTH domain
MLGVDVGGWVQALRERHRLTQGQLAHRAGTSQQAVSRIEAGEVSPSIAVLERLAACCGERLILDSCVRELPFEDAQLAEQASMSIAERLQLASSWNRLAGEITGKASKALADG